MSFKRTSRLFASAAVSAGLALGGLAFTAPAANAATTATGTAMYTCNTPLSALNAVPGIGSLLGPLASFKVPATFSLDTLPQALTANVPVPAGVPIVGQFQFPSTATGLSGILSSVSATLSSLLGPTPLNVVSTQVTNGLTTVSGQLGAFTPTSGLPLPIPTSFDASLILNNNPLLSLLGVKCTLDPGSTVVTNNGGGGGGGGGGTAGLPKQSAKVKAKGTKSVKPGSKAVVFVKVKTSAGQKGVGQIKAKAPGTKAKVKNLKNGKLRFVFRGLKVGKNKIKFSFLGNSYTNTAKKTFTVRVAR